MVEAFLRQFGVVDDDGVVEVTAFDQSGSHERFDFADKYESAR